mmetsp:Transcript_27368/g.109603  ORF Transcript_27368/g.109603 Transcript_27368/m.109603 type:complete len:223 (-) Transcript_27368:99-767(-)
MEKAAGASESTTTAAAPDTAAPDTASRRRRRRRTPTAVRRRRTSTRTVRASRRGRRRRRRRRSFVVSTTHRWSRLFELVWFGLVPARPHNSCYADVPVRPHDAPRRRGLLPAVRPASLCTLATAAKFFLPLSSSADAALRSASGRHSSCPLCRLSACASDKCSSLRASAEVPPSGRRVLVFVRPVLRVWRRRCGRRRCYLPVVQLTDRPTDRPRWSKCKWFP